MPPQNGAIGWVRLFRRQKRAHIIYNVYLILRLFMQMYRDGTKKVKLLLYFRLPQNMQIHVLEYFILKYKIFCLNISRRIQKHSWNVNGFNKHRYVDAKMKCNAGM